VRARVSDQGETRAMLHQELFDMLDEASLHGAFVGE